MPFHTAPDGCRIHYEATGTGPALVLIPGLGGDGVFWSAVAPHLQAGRRLIIVSHRGAGKSDRPEGPYSIPLIARDVLGVLDDLGIARAGFIGHSTGGMVAQTIAAMAPERAAGLVLSGTWDRVTFRFRRVFEARMDMLRHAGPAAYHKLTQAIGYDDDWLDAHAPQMEAELAGAEARLAPIPVQLARIAMLLEHDCHDVLPLIAAPTLVIGAADDALIPYRASERLAERIPGARLVSVTGGHFFPRSNPSGFLRHVSPFVQEIPA